MVRNCVIAKNGGTGIECDVTAAQGRILSIAQCLLTGNGGYGVDGKSGRVYLCGNRLRDNTSGNITSMGNYPTDLNNYVTDSDDATEYVDAANDDYRIKLGSTIHGKGYGAGDQPNTASGGRFGGINNSFVRRAA